MAKRLITLLAAALLAAPVFAKSPAPDDGLVSRRSSNFDTVRVASAFPSSYKSVYIPPIEVEIPKHRDANSIQTPSHVSRPYDVQRASKEMAQTLRGSMQASLQKAGYEIAQGPGAGVLVLKTSLDEVRINAPDNTTYERTRQYVREAGEARLHIDGYDGASNAKVLVIDDLARARFAMGGVERANGVTNRFWFQEMFDRWGDYVARELRRDVNPG